MAECSKEAKVKRGLWSVCLANALVLVRYRTKRGDGESEYADIAKFPMRHSANIPISLYRLCFSFPVLLFHYSLSSSTIIAHE